MYQGMVPDIIEFWSLQPARGFHGGEVRNCTRFGMYLIIFFFLGVPSHWKQFNLIFSCSTKWPRVSRWEALYSRISKTKYMEHESLAVPTISFFYVLFSAFSHSQKWDGNPKWTWAFQLFEIFVGWLRHNCKVFVSLPCMVKLVLPKLSSFLSWLGY